VSDPKQPDPGDPLHRAPPWRSDRSSDWNPQPLKRGDDEQALRKPSETVAPSLLDGGRNLQTRKRRDIFAEPVAKPLQEQIGPVVAEVPATVQGRRSFGLAAKLAMTLGGAAFIALVYMVFFPASQGPIEDNGLSASRWQALKSSWFPAPPQRKPPPTLTVEHGSGTVNEPLPLGIRVDAPGSGATVTIDGMLADARLTIGKRISAGQWVVPAQQISEASVIPPADFVGEMDLSAKLVDSDGAALVGSLVRLAWASAPRLASAAAAPSPEAVPSGPSAPAPPQQPAVTPPVSPADAVSSPPPARNTAPVPELYPNEIAILVRRAQELLASGDLQTARALLTRAANAHDARAALALAKTFDPNTSGQYGASGPGTDLEQARNWYQKAKEWGSPEAQRQLDALASYPR
jgi:hypothetical protein